MALSRNLADPGTVDWETVNPLAAERAALVRAIGPERLPLCWQTFGTSTSDEMRKVRDDPDGWQAGRCEAEVHLHMQDVRDAG